jgi:NAD+ kinase
MDTLFKTIALVGKYESAVACGSLSRLNAWLTRAGYRVLVTPETVGLCGAGEAQLATIAEMGEQADLVIVLGGDGTMLHVARHLAGFEVPMIGVNQGRLGFLADVPIDTMFPTLAKMLAGEAQIEERILLDCRVEDHDAVVLQTHAFNDVVVSKGAQGRLIEFEVYIDGQFVYSQRADGLVVATPTGSTAYALSAGGPILHPTLAAVVLAPICPHTLSARPIAVGSQFEIEINLIHAADARVHFDGQDHGDLAVGQRVIIRRAPKSVRLLHPVDHNYYDTLRQKLHWGEKL